MTPGPAVRRALPAALAAGAAATALAASGLLLPAERPVRDLLLRLRPARPAAATTLVLVDEESLRRVGPWPWPRSVLARLVGRLFDEGARAVALDVLLPEPREDDALLAAALARGPSLLAVGFDDEGRFLLPAPALLGAARLAHVGFDLDSDGVARRFSATRQAEGRAYPALAVEAARFAAPDAAIPVGASLRPGYAVRPESIPSVPAARALEGRATEVRGRVVLVGASAAGIGDRIVDPVSPWGSPVPGVRVQAAAAEAFLSGDLLRVLPPVLAGLLAALLTLAACALLPRPALGLALAASTFPLALAVAAWGRVELPVVATSLPVAVAVFRATVFEGRRVAREAARAAARVAELEALSASLAAERRDEAEVRRVVAHELKTPLTSLRGLAQLLGGFDLSASERSRVSGLVVAETGRLAAMVDALLDLERLRLKSFAKEARPVDLSALVEGRVALLAAGGRVAGDVARGVSVRGDARLLERVVENLVGNALKFSPEGAPVLVRLSSAAGREAVLEVEDRGPGVPAAERRRIFRRFARGTAPEAVPGLGLGLSLVADVASWHGGSVEVADAAAGEGSVFRVRLPLPAAAGG